MLSIGGLPKGDIVSQRFFSPKETKTEARDRRISGYMVPGTGFRKIQHFF
jgi:hypothetical protein